MYANFRIPYLLYPKAQETFHRLENTKADAGFCINTQNTAYDEK